MVRVAVIGAGPAGLIAAKNSMSKGHQVTVFEQEGAIGGVWLYSPDITKNSSMYERLLTNIPKQMMALKGRPFDERLPSFLPREAVLQYYQEYGRGIPVQFGSKVVNIKRKEDLWEVIVSKEGIETAHSFETVFVCSGHHSKPRSLFDSSNFKGQYLHSRDYRTAASFNGKRMVIVGAGYSGIDIGLQIAEVSSKVFLIGHHALYTHVPDKITQILSTVTDLKETSVLLENGEEVSEVDVVIDCRGYKWEYPFFSEDTVRLLDGGRMVCPLWLYVVHRQYPTSLFFIGMNDMTLQLPSMEHEVSLALGLVEGRITKPSNEEMEEWERQRLRYLEENARTTDSFHILIQEQFAHLEELCTRGSLQPIENQKAIEKLDKYVDEQRWANPVEYKMTEFKWNGKDFEVIKTE